MTPKMVETAMALLSRRQRIYARLVALNAASRLVVGFMNEDLRMSTEDHSKEFQAIKDMISEILKAEKHAVECTLRAMGVEIDRA
jgi:hypothetical protein